MDSYTLSQAKYPKDTQVKVDGRFMESQHPGMHCQYPMSPQMIQRRQQNYMAQIPMGDCSRDEQARADMEHSIDETVVHEEECCIVPLCTNQVPSNSEEPSVQSQQNKVSNSRESNPICSLRPIDAVIIFRLPSYGSSTRRYHTPMDIVFELFHPNPPNYVSEIPFLSMFEEPESKIIIYKDANHNYYRPIPPPDLFEEEYVDYFPYLSRKTPRGNHKALINDRNQRPNTLETTPVPSKVVGLDQESSSLTTSDQLPIGATTSNDLQALKPTLSYPPGFNPKITSQPMQIKEDLMKCEGQVMDNQELPVQDRRMFPHGPVVPTIEGSSYYQQSPHNGGAIKPVSASNSTLSMHSTHQGYLAHSTTNASYTGAQSAAAQTIISHGTFDRAQQLPYLAQPITFNTHSCNQSANMPMHSSAIEHMRSHHASLSNQPLKGAQNLPNVAHISTPYAHGITHNACMTPKSEYFMARTSASLHTSIQGHMPQHMGMVGKPKIMEKKNPIEQAMNSIEPKEQSTSSG